MATRISFSKIEAPKTLLGKLPRFSLDVRFNKTRIVMLYTPVSETLMRVWKEKKGIVDIAKKQFSEFENGTLKNQLRVKRKTSKK